jgi:SSS family solute:Na+ symporter
LKFLPGWTGGAFPDYPFLDRMTITFFAVSITMIAISLIWPKGEKDRHTIEVDKAMFKVNPSFVIGSVIICGILAALYTIYW